MISCLKPPVLLNCWKHHLGFVSRMINYICTDDTVSADEISKTLKSVGNSQFDLYTGKLSESEISDQIIKKLHENKVYEKSKYFKWLDFTGRGFRNISIYDGSVWTMLKGNIQNHYIHIHPARHSPHTIRVKANPWKSAIASLIYAHMDVNKACKPEFIDKSRQLYAGLEPVHEKFDHTIAELIVMIAACT